MNKKVKSISRITPIEDAQALWSSIDKVAVATEAAVGSMACDHHHENSAQLEQALQNLAAAVHQMKSRFATATGWYPVSIFADGLRSGVAREKISQKALDGILGGALHFDVMIEAFTFGHAELQQQAAGQAYEELMSAEPRMQLLGDWAEVILRKACSDAVARLYQNAARINLKEVKND